MISKRREHRLLQDSLIAMIRNSRVLIGTGNVIITGEFMSLFASNICNWEKIDTRLLSQYVTFLGLTVYFAGNSEATSDAINPSSPKGGGGCNSPPPNKFRPGAQK